MSSKTLPIFTALLALAMVLVLAFAMWTETLKVNSLVDTGEVDISYYNIAIVEDWEAEGKDVGKCSYTLSTDGILTVSIENGYPGYKCTVYFDIVNTGTIPVVGPFFNITDVPEGIQVEFYPAEFTQLHPGDSASYSIIVEVLQNAEEKAGYTVTIEITYIQWNEYIPTQPLMAKVSGFVWEDLDGDGEWDDFEPPLANIIVQLLKNNLVAAETTTNEYGYYEFIIEPGEYRIKPVLLTGYSFTTPSEIIITVYAGMEYTQNNFGMQAPPTPLELIVTSSFRHTNTNFNNCPAELGSLLLQIEANVKENKVRSISPGAFYYVMNISGPGVTSINLTINYDFHFDVRDGLEGMVRAYVLNTTTGCASEIKRTVGNMTYAVDNTNDIALVNITLSNPLTPDVVVLIYLKYRPAPGLIGSSWNTLDKYFDVSYIVYTNIGSTLGYSQIQIVEK